MFNEASTEGEMYRPSALPQGTKRVVTLLTKRKRIQHSNAKTSEKMGAKQRRRANCRSVRLSVRTPHSSVSRRIGGMKRRGEMRKNRVFSEDRKKQEKGGNECRFSSWKWLLVCRRVETGRQRLAPRGERAREGLMNNEEAISVYPPDSNPRTSRGKER